MKTRTLPSLLLLITIICLPGCKCKDSSTPDNLLAAPPPQADPRITEAYVYAYPLVLMDITRRHTLGRIFANHLIHMRAFPDHSSKSVVRPSNDLLYSTAWLDLSAEPLLLHLPDFGSRYYLLPFMDAWSNVFASLGTRTTGNRAQDFAVVGPEWHGSLPAGVNVIKSPTNTVWMLSRLYCTRTRDDLAAAHALQGRITLKPLGSSCKNYSLSPGRLSLALSSLRKKTPAEEVADMDAPNFFQYFANLLKKNPPPPADTLMVKKLAEIGIVPGRDFDINNLDVQTKNILAASVNAGQSRIKSYTEKSSVVNGWSINLTYGSYGADYGQRAFVALYLLGANIPQDSIYPGTAMDQKGHYLTGSGSYILHFPPGQTPPSKAFWSLTLYNRDGLLVDNPLKRYAVHSVDNLVYNKDGSLDIYMQFQSPGPDKEMNWLPAPRDNFNLTMRIYWPKEDALNGTWSPPPVQKVN
jgi:hypothetical protein